MARATAFAASFRAAPFEALRTMIICGCAIALIAAGRALPF
jgi:hypothetical protein